ncbi:MAG TPA: efflux RND transporter periplasmic adaptor subunit [Candidatus Angelobacter sp.]|jgi:RND family efflux transporter MFP subunit|nr:efflux RND transporter periplasmic adaptor subunit [Candidatus Angelobacter sp.]
MSHASENKTSSPGQPGAKHGRLALILLVLLALAGGLAISRRFSEKQVLARETEKLAVPTVGVIKPAAEPGNEELTLPAQLQPYVESAIYSRTNGYLQRWYKDIGSQVKKGDLLAEIETPEVDQELAQAKATRQQIEAQLQLARSTAERWANLRRTDSVSQQEADQQASAYTQAQANLAAANANVKRLEQLESFKRIYAPFSGVLTKRNVDVGALINAGSTGQNRELFDIAQVDPLRVFVSVPQANAASIRRGMPADIELREMDGQKFSGKVVRTADVIDPGTRTLLTEIDVPNPKNHLMPGAYAQVHFAVPVQTVRLSVPVNALLFRGEGPRVGVVGSDGKVHLKAISIGRDFGTKVEVLNGLDPNDRIIVNPADSLAEGQQVSVKSGGQPQS